MAYKVQEGSTESIVVDGVQDKQYSCGVSSPVFSPDSQHVAYWAGGVIGTSSLVLDGIEGNFYTYIYMPPVFSPDSKTVVYSAQENGKEHLIINGEESKPYDHILGGLDGSTMVFDSPNRLHYLAESGNCIYLVEQVVK